DVDIRTWVRTGDTPPGERDRMRRSPPHIVVTTPESLYILLGSDSGRAMLATTRTVIVDEIHALAPNKRGTHLAVSLERLAALCGDRLQRGVLRRSPCRRWPATGGSASASPPRRSRSRRSRVFWSERLRTAAPVPTAPSSIPATAARAPSRSRCRTLRSKP